jgi:superfamily II DNA or RNA helicase
MILRKHQRETSEAVDAIIAGSTTRTLVIHATPGAGKSALPLIAGRLIPAGLADRLCWICPRSSLQDQGERNFIDPRFRAALGHSLTIRQSTNERNPSRGTAGFITTYQALGVDRDRTVLQDFCRHRYILVLDEFHHLEESGEWTEPIRELYERAAFRVLMTGTMSRGDQKRIAFLPYGENAPGEWIPAWEGVGESELITYTRKDALLDQAIIPLEFHFADGVANWKKVSGKEVTAKLSTSRSDANQALYTALKTEYAQELLAAGVDHWKAHLLKSCMRHPYKSDKPGNGSLLVVAASIESAKEYTALLKRQGLRAEIATSDDSESAQKAIKAMKAGKLKILVSVAMAYEGLDVPSISHIICLTNIRSAPWIEQMVARAVRIDPLAGPYETQRGFIFAPADQMFCELARQIEADQCEAVAKVSQAAASPRGGDGSGEGSRPGITPLSSRLIQGQTDLFGYDPGAYGVPSFDYQKTQREIETELREQIDEHVRAWSRSFGYLPTHLNKRIKKHFGKYRKNMTVPELEAVKRWLTEGYAVPERKEPGIVLEPVNRKEAWG